MSVSRYWSVILPSVAVVRADRKIEAERPSTDDIEHRVLTDLADLPEESACKIAQDAFKEDLARIHRLEDKLATRRGALELLLPFTLTLTGASFRQSAVGLVCGAIAATLVIAGYFIAREADSTFQRHEPGPDELLATLRETAPARAQAVLYLVCYEANLPRSYQLNNRIWAAGIHLVQALAALAIGLAAYAMSF